MLWLISISPVYYLLEKNFKINRLLKIMAKYKKTKGKKISNNYSLE
jgi:hypothetical protein